MARPGAVLDHFILGRIDVRVFHHHGDGGAGGLALEKTGKNPDPVLLLAGGGDFALTGAAAVKFLLDIRLLEGQAGGTAFHHHTQGRSVGLAEGGYFEYFPETVS